MGRLRVVAANFILEKSIRPLSFPWINHKESDRWVTPKALHAKAADIPEIETDKYKVRVLHGHFEGKTPAVAMVTDVTLLHISLNANEVIDLPADEMAFIYVLSGSGKTDGQPISGQSLVNFSASGSRVMVQAAVDGLAFMYGTGMHLKEPIVYGGPFVMTTTQQMVETRKRYASGQMGKLLPYPS
jgi:redox-sensitive bicupin YhaK (pirin superfamily)